MYCAGNDLDMPDAFPCKAFTRYRETERRVRETPYGTDAQKEFGGASNLIGWRFRACYEDWQTYQEWFAVAEAQGLREANFHCERAMFGMFSSGVSCIESMTYSLAALASHPHVLSLPFDAQRQRECNPAKLAKWLNEYAAASSLKSALLDVTASTEWKFWVDLRNRMTHRSTLPRIIRVNMGAPTPPRRRWTSPRRRVHRPCRWMSLRSSDISNGSLSACAFFWNGAQIWAICAVLRFDARRAVPARVQ